MSTNNISKVELDRSPSLVIDPFIFAKSDEWENTENAIKAIPGTWRPRYPELPSYVMALVCCPFGHIAILHSSVSKVDYLGKVTPSYQCRIKDGTCSFHRNAYLDRWNKKPLYACAIERREKNSGVFKPEVIYTHASNQAEARIQLGPGDDYRIVAIGPAIGYFVKDKLGNLLSV